MAPRLPNRNGSRRCCSARRSSSSSRWSNSLRKMGSRDSNRRRVANRDSSKGQQGQGQQSASASGQAGGQSGQSAGGDAAAASRQVAPGTRSSPPSKPPTAVNRRRNRRSTACARRTTTCGAPPRRMPARPIPAAPPTACAQATDLLGGLQQQDAAGRLNSMAQTADQLAARQKQQADHVRDLIAQQNAARAAGQPASIPSAQEIDKMVNDRQQVSDDLARLTQQMRTAARELAPTQPAASDKLRSALDGMDENDLGTRMQRSSDWLRSGNFSDPAGDRPHQRSAKAGPAGRRCGSRLGQRAARFRRCRDQSRHGRSVPPARPTRRPRRESQAATAGPRSGSGSTWARRPTRRTAASAKRATQPQRPARPRRSSWPTGTRRSGPTGTRRSGPTGARRSRSAGQGGQGGQGSRAGRPGWPGRQNGQGGGRQSGPMGNPVTGGGGNRNSTVYRQPRHRQHAHLRSGRGAAAGSQSGRHAARDRPGIEPSQPGSRRGAG